MAEVGLTCGRAELYACISVLHGCLAQPMAFVSLKMSVWVLGRVLIRNKVRG